MIPSPCTIILTWYIEHHPRVEEQWNSSGVSYQSGVSAIPLNSLRVKMETDKSSLTEGGVDITMFILPPEKFLQFDWLRAVVFQLKFDIPKINVKITNLLCVVV